MSGPFPDGPPPPIPVYSPSGRGGAPSTPGARARAPMDYPRGRRSTAPRPSRVRQRRRGLPGRRTGAVSGRQVPAAAVASPGRPRRVQVAAARPRVRECGVRRAPARPGVRSGPVAAAGPGRRVWRAPGWRWRSVGRRRSSAGWVRAPTRTRGSPSPRIRRGTAPAAGLSRVRRKRGRPRAEERPSAPGTVPK